LAAYSVVGMDNGIFDRTAAGFSPRLGSAFTQGLYSLDTVRQQARAAGP